MNKVKLQDIEKVLEPLFSYWNSTRQEGESFGSFTNRMVSCCFFVSSDTIAVSDFGNEAHLNWTFTERIAVYKFLNPALHLSSESAYIKSQ